MKTLLALMMLLLASPVVAQQVALPDEAGRRPAIEFEHFPHRQYAFVWRNWSVVDKARIAQVLSTSVENVEALAMQMGLNPKQRLEAEWATTRGYITVLRRNWHLLPYEQLMQLLGMSREELRFRLIEDDFLIVKLGNVKPYCQRLEYTEPTEQMVQRAAQIAQQISHFGKNPLQPKEPRFDFMREFDKLQPTRLRTQTGTDEGFELRMIFPYFTDFGDPLLDKELSSYPEEYFRRLQGEGVNGIWLHSVLRMLVESDGADFPGDERAAERVEGLQRLVNRAAKYGIKVYLYVNEPRAMGEEYFNGDERRMSYAGAHYNNLYAFCPSNEEVLSWLSRSMNQLFTRVQGLGGVFTITASENYTTCASWKQHHRCPRCRDKSFAEITVAVNSAIEKGVHSAAPDAKVIVWDWGWSDNDCEPIISALPKSCWFMSVSEWSKPICRGGVETTVGEYSISVVGPGPRAQRNWAYARKAGLKTVAKVQVNSTWEMAVVPQIPVLDLVGRHAENLSKQNVDGVMLSWSLGGYPSDNLKLFLSYCSKESASEAVERLAQTEYGERVGEKVREAWRICSEAYENYPYHITTLYQGPQHIGPSNLFYTRPTGYLATMVGIPYDDYRAWCSVYPLQVWIAQMEKCAAGFAEGVELLQQAHKMAQGRVKRKVAEQLSRARAVMIHLKSGAVQAEYFSARDMLLKSEDEAVRASCRIQMREACEKEKLLIEQMLEVVVADSSIAFESSNQYFYLPADLLEAYISVNYALQQLQ